MSKTMRDYPIEAPPNVLDERRPLFGGGRAASMERVLSAQMDVFERMMEDTVDSCVSALTDAGMTPSHSREAPWVLAARAQAFVEEFRGNAPLEVVTSADMLGSQVDLETAIANYHGKLERGGAVDDAFAGVLAAALIVGLTQAQMAHGPFHDAYGKTLHQASLRRRGAREGGKAKAEVVRSKKAERDRQIRREFATWRASNPTRPASGIIQRMAKAHGLSPKRVRAITNA